LPLTSAARLRLTDSRSALFGGCAADSYFLQLIDQAGFIFDLHHEQACCGSKDFILTDA
jgi:hypothetical protein